MGPLPPPIGGVETFTQALLESPVLARFDVRHCDITKGRPKDTQGRFDAGNFVWATRHFARMSRAVTGFDPDVAYIAISGSWSGFLRDAGLGWIARRSRARVIGHQHAGDIADQLARRGLGGRLVRGGFAQFHRLLVLGERWRAPFVEYGITQPIEVCPSTFRREVLERAGDAIRSRRADTLPRLLFVGQVGRRKGILDLLDSLARLRANGIELSLTVVGPAQAPGELQLAFEHAQALALDTVAFTGPLTGEPLYDQFRRHDAFVLPSYNEGIPAVLYEAGAFGLAVVTTPVGGIPDLIRDQVNGLLVPPRDGAALDAALARLARAPEERLRYARQLNQDIAAFHPDRVAERVANAVDAELALASGHSAR
ncbi:MAG: glycosyltransferase family 4 protein [Candidatus Eisenbacteria bacterium]|uniref:Glycosyltransferase family 4 protein n=1 Tax=Eiseniibacteriota bacterium TaxID=2212470 RepID=A0A849SPX4_UNCEI|nr:glycosyltransferase family 4 protein [Candidatus Eisenbacteria bacterium]